MWPRSVQAMPRDPWHQAWLVHPTDMSPREARFERCLFCRVLAGSRARSHAKLLQNHISRHRLRSIDYQGLTLASCRVARPPGHMVGPYTSKSEQLSAIFDERWQTRSAKYAFGAFQAFPGLGIAWKGPEWVSKRVRAIGWPDATRAQSLSDLSRDLLLRQALRTDARGFCS